jgi:hypothetical protein
MSARHAIPILAILLGVAIASLGVAAIVWIVSSHLLGHGGFMVIVIGAVFIALGAKSIVEGARQLRATPSSHL